MSTTISRAGLMLGAIGIACASPARADDFRSTRALVESGLFLSQMEADAVYARLDAPRAKSDKPTPGTTAYWESGAVGLGQSERGGRAEWSGDATQMRLGADREIRTDLIVGASAGASIGGLSSSDLSARTVARHADLYGRLDGRNVFFKALVGVSSVSFDDLARSSTTATADGFALRAGGQMGGTVEVGGFKVTPTLALTANGHRVEGYREHGPDAAAFGDRSAADATATLRLSGSRKVRLAPGHTVDLSGFVGADEVLAFHASALDASVAEASVSSPNRMADPTGRGLFGGVGLATSLADGVTMKLDYDYGRRDGVATKTGRARVGVSF